MIGEISMTILKDYIRTFIGLLILAIMHSCMEAHKAFKKIGYMNIAVLTLQACVLFAVVAFGWFLVGCFLCIITA